VCDASAAPKVAIQILERRPGSQTNQIGLA
jgi:hypothetical protein